MNRDKQAARLLQEAEQAVQSAFVEVEQIARHNQRKVLRAFWEERVSAADFQGSTGYGLGDDGRDKLERIYAKVFGAEAGLVRPQIISGTHAIKLALFGVLRPGDHIVFATGSPYDTLEAVVGIRPVVGSLVEWGITWSVVPLSEDGTVDVEGVFAAIQANTKLVMFQRSRGYSERPALNTGTLQSYFSRLRERHAGVVIAVDNCYGEFVEREEPTAVGADLAMGSLIKNPGAGIAPTGGYIVGTQCLIDQVAAELTAPGVGAEAGPTHSFLRLFYQAFFLAPHTVSQALKSSILAAYLFEQLGLEVSPKWDVPRADLIVATKFGNPERLLAFCRAVQSCAPVDAYVRPEAAPMAGYDDDVVMAAGAFIQGGSLDMSADAPMRSPYIGYLQGALTYEHAYIALEQIVASLLLTN